MKKIYQIPFLLFLGLMCLVFITSCEKDDISEKPLIETNDNKPQLPDGLEIGISDTAELSDRVANFDYPQNNQSLDYGNNYLYRASYQSGSTRSAILVYQNGQYHWNNYWGADGLYRRHNIYTGSSAHNQLNYGKIHVYLWHLVNNVWVYQGQIQNKLRLNWVDPLPQANLMTSDYGPRPTYGYHSGVDFGHTGGYSNTQGKWVRAVASGWVVYTSQSNEGTVAINHGKYVTRYRHLDNLVANGSWVNAGNIIGRVAAPGVGGTDQPHLHFEYADEVNPNFYASNGAQADNLADDPTFHICHTYLLGLESVDVDESTTHTPLYQYCLTYGVVRIGFPI